MQTKWKSVLEILVIVAYIPAMTVLLRALGMALESVLLPLTSEQAEMFRSAIFGTWVALIAVGALVLLLRGRKAAGGIMAVVAFIAAMIVYTFLTGGTPPPGR